MGCALRAGSEGLTARFARTSGANLPDTHRRLRRQARECDIARLISRLAIDTMKIQFQGSVDPDDVANAFILAYLARHRGRGVTADRVWKGLRSGGFVPTDGRPTSSNDLDNGAAIAEIQQRLEKWLEEGIIGGESAPESLTGQRHFWVIGKALANG